MPVSISQLFVYPVKSLGGFEVQHSHCLLKGLKHDRRWMLVDSNHRFLTQRTMERLCLFKAQVGDDNVLSISHAEEHCQLHHRDCTEATKAIVWHDEVNVMRAPTHVNDWFSDLLSMHCSLVFMPEGSERKITDSNRAQGFTTSLSDAYPLLVVSEESLMDLNSRMATPISIDRFRPNLVLRGLTAYAEDNIYEIETGTMRIALVKPCARCVVTTIHQQTMQRSAEPLATLATYRRVGSKVMFGMDAVPLAEGVLTQGEPVTAHYS